MIMFHIRMDEQEDSMVVDTEDTPLQACRMLQSLLIRSELKPHRFQITARDEAIKGVRRGAQIRFRTEGR